MDLRYTFISIESFDHYKPHVNDVSSSNVINASDPQILSQVLARYNETGAADLGADILFDKCPFIRRI